MNNHDNQINIKMGRYEGIIIKYFNKWTQNKYNNFLLIHLNLIKLIFIHFI